MARPLKKKFTPEMADVIIELGKQGASQKAMYAAIGISKSTAANWKANDPVFSEAMSMATTYGQAYWENMMLANIDNKNFNSRVAEIALKGQYPDDYGNKMDIKQDIKADVKVIDFNAAVDDLLRNLKEAEE
jgi:hypothetical protein